MADLLTHIFVGYTIGMVLTWKYDKLKSAHVTAVMVGSTLPDLVRIRLLLDPVKIEQVLGIPFSWGPLHTAGGVIIIVAIGSLLSVPKEFKVIFILLLIGAASHLLLDALLISVSGYSYAVLWPFLDFHPPTPGLYLSTDVWPAMITGIIALLVRMQDQIR